MIHVYSGKGKGKTTAAVGLAVRAAGAGMRVYFYQFLKNGSSSEIKALRELKNVTVGYCRECNNFTFQMNEEEKNIVKNAHNKLLDEIKSHISKKSADLIVIDELFGAYNALLIDRKKVRDIIYNCPENIELILTGRAPTKVFRKAADYYSVINAVKHPFDNGIRARKGIEY